MQAQLTTVVVLLSLILISLWLVLYQLVKQQGRMLLRLDELEGRAHGGGRAAPGGVQIGLRGLGVGKPFDAFSLPDLGGRTVSLAALRGRRVLVVNWSPQCGFCDLIAPELVRLHKEHGNDRLAVVMVGRGEPEENRRKAEQHGFEFPFILQDRWKLSKEYGIFATPVAFLIDEQGVIARGVGTGADEILALAHEALSAGKEAGNGRAV